MHVVLYHQHSFFILEQSVIFWKIHFYPKHPFTELTIVASAYLISKGDSQEIVQGKYALCNFFPVWISKWILYSLIEDERTWLSDHDVFRQLEWVNSRKKYHCYILIYYYIFSNATFWLACLKKKVSKVPTKKKEMRVHTSSRHALIYLLAKSSIIA